MRVVGIVGRQVAQRRLALHGDEVLVVVEVDEQLVDFVDFVDPLGALTDTWVDAVGHRLDPWWESAHPV